MNNYSWIHIRIGSIHFDVSGGPDWSISISRNSYWGKFNWIKEGPIIDVIDFFHWKRYE